MLHRSCCKFLMTLNALRNSKAARINTGRRFLQTDLKIPGPGTYELKAGEV